MSQLVEHFKQLNPGLVVKPMLGHEGFWYVHPEVMYHHTEVAALTRVRDWLVVSCQCPAMRDELLDFGGEREVATYSEYPFIWRINAHEFQAIKPQGS